jgi:hypothetical protein
MSEVYIQVKHVKLGQHPDFEALSYSWGTDPSKVPIWCNQRKFNIPRSLWEALNRLRHPHSGQSRVLWADAICINQEDVEEKTAQVQLMREIYQAAKLVIVWLGEEAYGSHEAIQMVKRVGEGIMQYAGQNAPMTASYTLHQRLVLERLPGPFDATWAAYWTLLQRPWYSRVWIIQEVASAADVLIVCGADEVSWLNFWSVACYVFYSGLAGNTIQLSYLTELVLVGTARETFQRHHQQPLIDMLFQYRSFQATDQRDKIFALYGLLHNDCRTGAIPPDYSLKPDDVFRKTTVAILEDECNLDILSGPVNGYADQASGESASWVACWAMANAPFPMTFQHIRRGDPLFDASARSQHAPRFLEDQRIMEVSGFILDTIICVGQPTIPWQNSTGSPSFLKTHFGFCYQHRLFLDWERVAEARSTKRYFNGENMVDVYWQTLLGGFTAFTDMNNHFVKPGGDAKVFYKTLFLRWDREHRFYLNLHKALHWLPGIDYLCCGLRLTYGLGQVVFSMIRYIFGRRTVSSPGPQFNSYNSPCLGRKIVRTTHGYVGLAPRLAEVGDKIAILKGGRVPYALRPVGTRWRLLGDAYIHGIMRGEGFKEDRCERMWLE